MKIKIFVFFLIISTNHLYGQNLSGCWYEDLNHINNFIERFSQKDFGGIYPDGFYKLFNLDKSGLRVVINTIYAKYGYKFISTDLNRYFSQFKWYNGTKTNVDNEINSDEWAVIEFLRQMEANYPSNISNKIVGIWWLYLPDDWWTYSFGTLPNGTELRFWKNGIFHYCYYDNDLSKRIYYYGFWSYSGGGFKMNFLYVNNEYKRNYNNFIPSIHNNMHTRSFQENIIFYNKNINYHGEEVWECNFQKNFPSWKKANSDPNAEPPG
jgi:hypothetical protein